jgi:hypothetical protein
LDEIVGDRFAGGVGAVRGIQELISQQLGVV